MELGYISPETYPVFRTLLSPPIREAYEQKEPVTLLGVAEERVACGALGGYLNEGIYQLISLYVAPAYRRRGFGRCLIDQLKQVLSPFPAAFGIEANYTPVLPEHDTLKPFLSAMGFTQQEHPEQNIYLFPLSEAAESPFFSSQSQTEQPLRSPSPLLPFSEIPDRILAMAERKCREHDGFGPELPLTSPQLERELSHALLHNQEVVAFLTFDRSCCERLTLSCAWAKQGNPAAFPALLRAAFRSAAKRYPPDTPFAVQSTTANVANLIHALLPKAVPASLTYTCLLS